MKRVLDPQSLLKGLGFVALAGGCLWFGRLAGRRSVPNQAEETVVRASDRQVRLMLERFPIARGTPMLIEAMDFECPPCRAMHPFLASWTKTHPDVRFETVHFPLSFHLSARPAAIASEIARESGKFDRAFQHFYTQKLPTDQAGLDAYLKTLGIDPGQAKALAGARRRVDADLAFGKAFGIDATPTLLAWNGQSLYLVNSPEALEATFGETDHR